MKNIAKSKICHKCHQSFIPTSNVVKWCNNCRTVVCQWCKKIFISQQAMRKGIRFCSRTCLNVWQQDPKTKEDSRQRTIAKRGRGEVRRCQTCNEAFYAPGWLIDKSAGKYCSWACRDFKADASHGHWDKVLLAVSKMNPTKLEQAGAELLKKLQITFLEQQPIGGKFVVDILLPDISIVIQWDGDFWHGKPSIYPIPGPLQKANKDRDKRCDAYLMKCGYTVLRFWESDVHERPAWVESVITLALANSAKT